MYFAFLDLNSWLKLYGYDIGNMIGSSYTRNQLHQPSAKVSSPQLTPQFNVVSGLQCIVEKVYNEKKLQRRATSRNFLNHFFFLQRVFFRKCHCSVNLDSFLSLY